MATQDELIQSLLELSHELVERCSMMTLAIRALSMAVPADQRQRMRDVIGRELVTGSGMTPKRAALIEELLGDPPPRFGVIKGGRAEE